MATASLLVRQTGVTPPPIDEDGDLQPINSSAAQYALRVGSKQQTLLSIGSGLGSPGGQSKSTDVARCLDVMGELCTELRINTPSSTYLASVKEGLKRYVKRVHVTGYTGISTGAAASLAAGVANLNNQGMSVTSCSLQNEPNFRLTGDAAAVDAHKALRDELNKKGLNRVDIVGPEFANNDGQTLRCAKLLAPLAPTTVQAFGHHSYGLGVDDNLYNKTLLGHMHIREYECGYNAFTSLSARILNDLNHGCETWVAHRLHNTVASSDPSQNLFDNACRPYVWYTNVYKVIFSGVSIGTAIRGMTVVSSNADAANMRWRSNNNPGDYHSPIYATCGQRADGKWVVASYAWSGKQQPTITFPELKGRSMLWKGNKSTSSGVSATSAQMSDGVLRYTANSSELTVLVSS